MTFLQSITSLSPLKDPHNFSHLHLHCPGEVLLGTNTLETKPSTRKADDAQEMVTFSLQSSGGLGDGSVAKVPAAQVRAGAGSPEPT